MNKAEKEKREKLIMETAMSAYDNGCSVEMIIAILSQE